jgi:hypothetical protein
MTRRTRVAAAVALAMVVITTTPYVIAALRPPEGAVFTGIFFYQDDVYQYLSFIEQSARGAFVFVNKFDPRPHSPLVVNFEWWSAGVLARVLGGSPVLGFHALRILAIFGLVAAAARLLAAAGHDDRRLAWGLALVATGGGLGWLRLAFGAPGWRVPDIITGLYPFHQALMNAHFVTGTALFLWTAILHLDWRAGRRSRWGWVAAGWALGLSRPYELVSFAIGAFVLAWLRRRERSPIAASLELAWITPVFAYYAFIMQGQRGLGGWTGVVSGDLSPPLPEVVFGLLPALVIVLLFARKSDAADAQGVRGAVTVWLVVIAAIVFGFPSPMAKQFGPTLGPLLLILAALVTPARWMPAAVVALCPTAVFLLWRVLHPFPTWFEPREYRDAVRFLGGVCGPADVAIAPTDLSLKIAGLTPCRVGLGHRALTPAWPTAIEAGNRFYDPATPAPWRAEYLRALRARFVLLPAGAAGWLPAASAVQRLSLPRFEIWEIVEPRPDPSLQNPGG